MGGKAKVCGIIAIPLGIAGMTGILEATVVEDPVPLLIPIKLLRQLGAAIDLNSMELTLRRIGKTVKLGEIASGHIIMDVLDFGAGGFVMPADAVKDGYCEKNFRSAAALVLWQQMQSMGRPQNFNSQSDLTSNAAKPCGPNPGDRPHPSGQEEGPRGGQEHSLSQSAESDEELASADGSIHRPGQVRWPSRMGLRMAINWIAARGGGIPQVNWRRLVGCIRHTHQERGEVDEAEEQGVASQEGERMSASHASTSWRRQSTSKLRGVRNVSLQVETGSVGVGDQGNGQVRETARQKESEINKEMIEKVQKNGEEKLMVYKPEMSRLRAQMTRMARVVSQVEKAQRMTLESNVEMMDLTQPEAWDLIIGDEKPTVAENLNTANSPNLT